MRTKKRHYLMLTCGLFLIVSETAYASDYFGGGVGKTNIDVDRRNIESTSLTIRDFSDKYYKIFFGSELTPALAWEFGYINLGEYQEHYTENTFNADTDFSATAIFAGLTGLIDLEHNWFFIGKLGLIGVRY